MHYCGVSKSPMRRIWQHICYTRFAHYGRKDLPLHYKRVAAINCDSMYAFCPLAYTPNETRLQVESFYIGLTDFSLNYTNYLKSNRVSSSPDGRSIGAQCRFKSKCPSLKWRPSMLPLQRCDLTIYSCAATGSTGFKLEDLLLSTHQLSAPTSYSVQPGTCDATNWDIVCMLFGKSMISFNNGPTITLSEARLYFKMNCISDFTVSEWKCKAVHAKVKILYNRLLSSLQGLSEYDKTAKLYASMGLADKFYNTYQRSCALKQVKKAFDYCHVRPPPKQLPFRLQYDMCVSKTKLSRSIRYIVGACALPQSARTVVVDRTHIVNKSPTRVCDIVLNSIVTARDWTLTPWEHSDLCNAGLHPCRETYGCRCMAFRADEYNGPFSDIVQLNLKTIPVPDSRVVFHRLITSLLSYQQRLQRFTSVSVTTGKVKQLAYECNNFRGRRAACHGPSPPTLREVRAMAKYFKGCVLQRLDKNSNMLFISCKHFYWQQMYKTFEFAATGSPLGGLNYVASKLSPEDYVKRKKDAYSWHHIAPFSGRRNNITNSMQMAQADPVQKFSKEKARPMVRCHREPDRMLKHRICRVGFFILMQSGLDHLGVSSTRLLAYLDRWKHRRQLATSAASFELMDDMSGFYTSLNRIGVLERAKYVLDRFKERHRKPRHWLRLQCHGNFPVRFGKSSSDDYVSVHVDDVQDVLQWATNFSCFMLGTVMLEQVLGLFQGCALSVILALMTAAADEAHWLALLGADRPLVCGLRYVDDRYLRFVYLLNNPESKATAYLLKTESSCIYMEGIVCEVVDPGPFLESIISEEADGKLVMRHYNKNWESIDLHGRPLYLSQPSRASFCGQSKIDGYRMARLRAVVSHCSSFGLQMLAVQQTIAEWLLGLGDEIADVLRVVTRLWKKHYKPRKVWTYLRNYIKNWKNRWTDDGYEDCSSQLDSSQSVGC